MTKEQQRFDSADERFFDVLEPYLAALIKFENDMFTDDDAVVCRPGTLAALERVGLVTEDARALAGFGEGLYEV